MPMSLVLAKKLGFRLCPKFTTSDVREVTMGDVDPPIMSLPQDRQVCVDLAYASLSDRAIASWSRV